MVHGGNPVRRVVPVMKLVQAERRGRMVYYSLGDTHIRHILDDTIRHVSEGGRG